MNDPLSPLVPAPLSLISNTRVPNIFPEVEVPYRLAIVGEAPGADEEAYGLPFVGASGKLLDSLLNQSGILRSGCFVGNICKYRPPGNDIKAFGYDHEKVLSGFAELQAELAVFKPHAICALGNTPLHFLAGRTGITNWRGSILSTPYGKVVPALHPAAVLREYKDWVLLRFDLQRARAEAEDPSISLPQRTLELDLSADEICLRLSSWPAGRLLSFDIEGGLDAFPCCSVAAASNSGFIIAWSRHSDSDQGRIAVELSRVLYRNDVPKVLQNSLYDRFVLAYGYRMLIRNVVEDTMDKSCCIYPELSRGLSTITSIWTRQPYYKSELMIYSDAERKRQLKAGTYDADRVRLNQHKGCIIDSCVTLEACLAMDGAMSEQEKRYYKFTTELKSPLLYMQLRGFRYDTAAAEFEKGRVRVEMAETASRIEAKVTPMQFTKKEFSSCIRGEKGCIGDKRLAMVLYQQKGYPEQKKGRGPTARVTADAEALLNLSKKYPSDPFLSDILLHRKLESVLETVEWSTDPTDGRMKCSYNQYGKGDDGSEEGGGSTETMRLRCSKSLIPDGKGDYVGGNLQTVTKKLRRLYLADEGKWLFQCDLAGADGWTVAAHCLRHGDPTMWEDYCYGLKPALILVLMYQGKIDNRTSRVDIARLSAEYKQWEKENESESWLYFGCKRIQHSSNYDVKWKTGTAQIMKDSYKLTGTPVYMDKDTFETLQRYYFVRYHGIYQWHNWARREVLEGRNLTSASGHERKFFGRRKAWNYQTRTVEADHDTFKEFLADSPQENTTYATNLALHKLWHDPENRESRVLQLPSRVGEPQECQRLLIEPLHQVHDALIGQFPKEKTDWAKEKIRSWFQNQLIIAGTPVTIPFEGSYGPSWGEMGTKYGGGDI